MFVRAASCLFIDKLPSQWCTIPLTRCEYLYSVHGQLKSRIGFPSHQGNSKSNFDLNLYWYHFPIHEVKFITYYKQNCKKYKTFSSIPLNSKMTTIVTSRISTPTCTLVVYLNYTLDYKSPCKLSKKKIPYTSTLNQLNAKQFTVSLSLTCRMRAILTVNITYVCDVRSIQNDPKYTRQTMRT